MKTSPRHTPWEYFATCIVLAGLLMTACDAADESQAGELPSAHTTPTGPVPASSVPSTVAAPLAPLHGTIRVWVDWAPEEMSNLLALVESFQQSHPGVAFAVSYYSPGTLLTSVESAAGGQDSPTLFFGPSSWGPGLWREGLVQDVAERVLPEHRQLISLAAWSQVEVGPSIIGMPIELQGQVLFRNRALLSQEAGTVGSLVQLARQRSDEGLIGARLDLGFDSSSGFLAACGDLRLTQDGQVRLDDATGVCWLTLMQALSATGVASYGDDSDRYAFLRRLSPWLLDRSDLLAELGQSLGEENLAVDAWPTFEATGRRLASHVWTQNAYFSSRAAPQDTEAAWAFLAFLLTPEAQMKLSLAGSKRHLPVVSGLPLGDSRLAELALALQDGIGLPQVDQMAVLAAILDRAGRSVAEQGVDPTVAWGRAMENLRTSPSEP